jgi:hypothetical protein
MDFNGKILAPAIATISKLLDWFAKDNWELRKQQALNAARGNYFLSGTLTGATVLFIPQAQQSDQVFSFMLFVSDQNSGKGRYRVDSADPNVSVTPPIGLPIFSGGYSFDLGGHENIKALRIMAESGETINYSIALFQ